MSAYSEASKAVFEVFEDTTPLVEGLSIDEAFLDVRGLQRLAGPPTDIAARLRQRVLDQVGLPITVGIARTKFLAKVASAVAKPNGLLVVPPDDELGFLHPLPVERLWGVGRVTAEKLHSRGITTVGQVARLEEQILVWMVGRAAGRQLHALAHNRDPRPVRVGRRRRSIGSQRALGLRPAVARGDRRDARGHRRPHRAAAAEGEARLPHGRAPPALPRLHACDPLARRCPRQPRERSRSSRRRGGCSWRRSRSSTPRGSRSSASRSRTSRTRTGVQLALPFDPLHDAALDAALDEVRERYGSAAVTRGVLVGRDPGVVMPLLPD